MPEAIEEGEGVAFHERVRPAFDQGEISRGFLGQKPLVTQADQPVGNVLRVEPEIFGPQLLAAAPVAHADIDEHSLVREHIEECGVVGVIGMHKRVRVPFFSVNELGELAG